MRMALKFQSFCPFMIEIIRSRKFPLYPCACVRLFKLSSSTWAAAATLPPLRPVEKHLSFMAKELFGTDGIRGTPGTSPLDDATLYATGRSVGSYLKRKHGSARVLIGMDTRESGPHIASLLAAGLTQA